MIRATWFDGRTATPYEATLVMDADTVRVHVADGSREWPAGEVRLTADLGTAPRWIHFPDDSSCEVSDGAALSMALTRAGRPAGPIARWHDNMRLVLVSLAGLVVLIVLVYLFVLPPVADRMARRLPASALDIPSQTAEQWLNEQLSEPTALPHHRIVELHALLNSLELPDAPGRPPLRLEIRRGTRLGANAIALPSGLIVMTDELVQRSTDDRALLGILAHEVGHIQERHALRRLIKDSTVGLIVAGLLGDVNGVVLLAPGAFLSTRHSREFETEADTFAIDVLRRMGVSLTPLADLLTTLPGGDSDAGYLSTHPPTPERVERLRAAGSLSGLPERDRPESGTLRAVLLPANAPGWIDRLLPWLVPFESSFGHKRSGRHSVGICSGC